MTALRLFTVSLLALCGSSVPEVREPGPSGGALDETQEAPRDRRIALRRLVMELSKLGAREEVGRVRAVLEAMGDPPDDLKRLSRTWERNLERRKPGTPHESLLEGLRSEASHLAEGLERAEPGRREDIARLVLELDSEEPRANAVLGRVQHEGRWLLPAEVELARRRDEVAALVQRALRLDLEVRVEPSSWLIEERDLEDPRGGEAVSGALAAGGGVELHAWMDPAKLERILRQALRAVALSNALRGDELAVRRTRPRYTLLLCDTQARFDAAMFEALEGGGLTSPDAERHREEKHLSYVDRRGWRTSRWRPEAEFQALVAWEVLLDTIGDDAQACLVAGHVNWVILSLIGTSMPSVEWREVALGRQAGRSTSEPLEVYGSQELYRSARRTLFGCRSWMARRVREGADPPWSRAMVDRVGKITDEPLLKTTLVVELLQERGEFEEILELTRFEDESVPAFEDALGTDLESFEAEWREWLLFAEEDPRAGVVQTLSARSGPGPGPPGADPPGAGELLLELNAIRGRALVGQTAEVAGLALDPELSRGALLHSRYLASHPDQRSAWPDLHEEYADREGFSSAGARAGRHGVIAFTGEPAEALGQWMASFYHRLPLLHPGLIGIGVGIADGVTTVDVESLVLRPSIEHWVGWPADFASGVPLRFQPELPNPVPGEDMAGFGYPVTLQVFAPERDSDLAITLRLFEGERDGTEVDCHVITPARPLFAELAPPEAWCLIPKAPLSPGTRYTVLAECLDPPREEVWRFRTAEE